MAADLATLISRAARHAPLAAPLAVYGAGGKGGRTLRFLEARGLEVAAVLDSHARPGQTCEGRPVHAPAAWASSHAAQGFTAVVAIHNPGADHAALGEQIRALGFGRVVQPVELHQIFGDALGHDYFLAPAAYYAPHLGDIARARDLLADAASRAWYDAALEYRLGGDARVLPTPSAQDQYMPRDLARWREPMRLADCGAYDGDSVRAFLRDGYRIEALAAFEPDPANFAKLGESAAAIAEKRLTQRAVGARAGVLRFSAGQGAASHLDPRGTVEVHCTTLDEALEGFRPTLVKFDVEGAEGDALAGGARVIAQARPGLAVSAYHRPEHLWQLALLVHQWNLGYRFYLRGHAHSTFDLVLYALPA